MNQRRAARNFSPDLAGSPEFIRDYPNAAQTEMTDIDLRVAANPAVLNWNRGVMTNPAYGEHSEVVSNASPGGQVDLYY
jgi:hypothetical protein